MTNKELKRVITEKKNYPFIPREFGGDVLHFFREWRPAFARVVEERGLFQTPQESDEKDKEVDVFYEFSLTL